ncbi:MAG: hypothetical protein IKJ94_03740 [Oscillospiraceae bacterium]|nr:hypothetical protein [Oscillospiraceae bacterium]
MKKNIGIFVLLVLWGALAVFAWVKPAGEASEAERRPLAQFPAVSGESLLSGQFVTDFEDYTLDQFPGRDLFRKLKALTHYNLFGQRDNNGIYIADGYAAKLDYPVRTEDVDHALTRLSYVYETFLKPAGSKVYTTVIPDKGYYLAEENGYPAMDYEELLRTFREKLPFGEFVDITDCLDYTDYYFTDTHWRQENLLPVAQKLSAAMGVTPPQKADFTQTKLDRPFYGVYYGQAALAMDPEDLYILESDLLDACQVYDFETDKYTPVYNLEKLSGKDPYDVFLSGAKSLLRLENLKAKTDRELLIFRDSFGSSLAPLLAQDYKTVTLVDIRYLDSRLLGNFLEFNGQDVLFAYSTSVLNSGTTLK